MHVTQSPKAVNFQPAILAALAAALFIAGIALGSIIDVRLASAPAAAPAPDTSYNAVEGARAQYGVAPDTSYSTVESMRAKSGVTENTDLDVLMAARAKAAEARAQSGVTVDTDSLKGKSGFPSTRGNRTPSGASSHDKARGAAGWWASAPVTTVAGTPVSQADPNDRVGGGIR
jgi:hypothetical protein